MGTDEKLLLALAGTMVAGYRSYITFHEQGHEEQPSKEERSDSEKRHFFKTFSADKNHCPPTHPPFNDDFVQKLGSSGKEAKDILNKITDPKKRLAQMYKHTTTFEKTPGLKPYWTWIDGYVKQKWVWQFDEKSKDWKMSSIADFTDNENIRQMVTPCYFIRIASSSNFATECTGVALAL